MPDDSLNVVYPMSPRPTEIRQKPGININCENQAFRINASSKSIGDRASAGSDLDTPRSSLNPDRDNTAQGRSVMKAFELLQPTLLSLSLRLGHYIFLLVGSIGFSHQCLLVPAKHD